MDEVENYRMRLKDNDIDRLHETIFDIGKSNCYDLEKEIASFLHHEEADIRSAAIRVLAFYWQLDNYKDAAEQMFLDKSEPDHVRDVAVMSWGIYYYKKNSSFAIEKLYKIVCDKNEPDDVRASAYNAILSSTILPVSDVRRSQGDTESINDLVDWPLLDQIREVAR
ncbi:MAG: hypothetical protein F9K24_21415 [Leptonema illini]|uniref:HEAT repeat domain-containing protein n=1 Tax=Leptonema illini TaxID=183 RepID=A0A833GXF8_9LEPT|nr:MAG: hypothetical protein F9K24_21415 [Leptonema illini]